MYYKSKKVSLFILGITSLVCSRTMLVSLDDPEGPNLLVITGLAAIIYFLSLAVYLYKPAVSGGLQRLLMVIFIQILLTTIFYVCLK